MARTLEQQWEAALTAQAPLQADYARFLNRTPTPLSAAERTRIRQLNGSPPSTGWGWRSSPWEWYWWPIADWHPHKPLQVQHRYTPRRYMACDHFGEGISVAKGPLPTTTVGWLDHRQDASMPGRNSPPMPRILLSVRVGVGTAISTPITDVPAHAIWSGTV